MSLSEVDISLNIQNNRNYPQQINVMGNPSNLLDTANAKREFQYDVTSFVFTNEDSVSIQYKVNGAASFLTFTGLLPSQNIQGIVDVLNSLQIGYFNTYTQLGNTYISTYNDNYQFGSINIFSSSVASIINPTFISGTGFNAQTFYSVLSLGKVLVAGTFNDYNGNTVNNLVRLNLDGSIDNTFSSGSGISGLDATIYSLAVQTDDKILVAGSFDNYDGNAVSCLIRLNTDGTLDNTFSTGTGFSSVYFLFGTLLALLIQTDGKIIVGGEFDNYDGNAISSLIRLNTNGSYDNTFNQTVLVNSDDLCSALALQTDGKIIVGGGTFTSQSNFLRLNTNGTIDGTFVTGTGFNVLTGQLNVITIQTDGKVLVGLAECTDYNGTAINNVVRLNTNGSVDNTFGTGILNTTPPTNVITIKQQLDGKILIGGQFNSLNGVSTSNDIIRTLSNCTLDTSWNTGIGFDGTVRNILINTSNIFVTGSFISFDGTPQGNISNLLI